MTALFLGNASVISHFYLFMQVLQTPGGGVGVGGCFIVILPRSLGQEPSLLRNLRLEL